MKNKIKDFLKNEDGGEVLEYVVIDAFIITIGLVAYSSEISGIISTAFTTMITTVTG